MRAGDGVLGILPSRRHGVGGTVIGLSAMLWVFLAVGCNGPEDTDDVCFDTDGNGYAVGESFPDDCNTCTCESGGSVSCTEMGCLD